MDDRIPGKEPPTIESQDVMNLLTSPAERRAFEQFRSEMAVSAGEVPESRSVLNIWLHEHSAHWHRRRQQTAAQLQAEEIRKYRWIESEKHQRDLGKAAHVDWVRRYAAEWREWFENNYDGPLEECD